MFFSGFIIRLHLSYVVELINQSFHLSIQKFYEKLCNVDTNNVYLLKNFHIPLNSHLEFMMRALKQHLAVNSPETKKIIPEISVF